MASLAENLSALDAALAALGPPPAPSVRQAVLARRAALKAKHAEGYSFEELAAALTAQGLPIKPNTLRAYLTGNAAPSRAGRAAKSASDKHFTRDMKKTSAKPGGDLSVDLDLGTILTEATSGGAPVRAARVR